MVKWKRHALPVLLLLLGLPSSGFPAGAQSSSPPAVYAIVGARIEVGDGRVIEKGTVVLRDGLIEAAGANVTVPPNAEVIRGAGLVVYPGFIDAIHFAYFPNELTPELERVAKEGQKDPDTITTTTVVRLLSKLLATWDLKDRPEDERTVAILESTLEQIPRKFLFETLAEIYKDSNPTAETDFDDS